MAAWGQEMQDCTLIDGVIAPGCDHAAAGTVVAMPVGANTEADPAASDLGPYGFAISIDAAEPGSGRRDIIAGPGQPQGADRQMDRLLSQAGVQITYDGLGVRPRLAIATEDLKSSYVAGQAVTFRASSNYPAWIAKAEIRVTEAGRPSRVVAVIPVAANGTAAWTMPASGDGDLSYSLRVYDSAGRFDETTRQSLNRSATAYATEPMTGPILAAAEGEDMTAKRSIPVRGGAVTVSGNTRSRAGVTVMGERAIADDSGRFVMQRILPPGVHDVRVGVGKGVSRRVEVPQSDWFYIGLADLTVGKRTGGDSYTLGRLAGYAKGHTPEGWTITGALDTGEGELKDLFRDLDAKNVGRTLDRIKSEDVYPTFGDDSTLYEDAPTSGKVYLKVEKDRSSVMWGDFKLTGNGSRLIRSDRTLYGLNLLHESLQQTAAGEARLKLSAYGAQPDRLVQRDVLRGTGGSAYFLKRQDILYGTETILVQYRDPVSGHVVQTQTLVAGEDYEIDYFQGVVILKRPLGSSVSGGGVVTDRPLGDYDANLVAQYEYVPTTGSVDGISAGGRVEGWVSDTVRLGVSAATETTGLAENEIAGADVLIRQSAETYLSFDYARSEGPGFGNSLSFNGGLDINPGTADPSATPSAGSVGLPADAWRVEAAANLAEVSGGRVTGEVLAFYDKKEAGFVSSDYDIGTTQTSYGIAGNVGLSARTKLTFGYEDFEDAAGKHRMDGKLGVAFALSDLWSAEIGLATTDRTDPAAALDAVGKRTDLGARLTWTRDDDLQAWVFGQSTVSRSGGLPENNRLGFGVAARLNDRLTAEAEMSDGSLGAAGKAALLWDNGQGTNYRVGYTLDPTRDLGAAVTGEDKGVWVVGADSRVNDSVSYRAENTYDLFGDRKALTTAFGVRYSPSDVWTYDANLEFGDLDDGMGNAITRRAIGAGVGYAQGDEVKAGLKAEYRTDSSTDGSYDRDTWLLSGYSVYKTDDNWRLMFDLDALVSDSDQSSVRDGRYIEGNIGFAYRPVDNDRLNALVRYTYLEDLPGADQVNIEGDVDGPRQRSHILSFDVNYDLNEQFTLGAKYGYRLGEVADRATDAFAKSTADLAILRLDYHVVHNWDLLVEGRMANYHETDTQENAALVGVYRHFGNNMKVGVGYQAGDVSDDLRLIEGRSEGAFLNIVGKF